MGKAKEISLTQDLLHNLFHYDGNNLIWRNNRANGKIKAGSIAGCIHHTGYRHIRKGGRLYQAHRLLWIYYYGSIDKDIQIDHINGIRDDNRIENLRLATTQENAFNRKNAKGYYWDKQRKKYRGHINLNGKKKCLGFYNTTQEAHQAYLDAKKTLHIIKDRI